MEFDFNINKFLPDTITILRGQDVIRHGQDLRRCVDSMGEASRIAQNLRKPVTIASAFTESNQKLYMMKDSSANNGHGAVVGMLKTGPKRLFLLDKKGNQMNELNPICVLDFYIHESCQRMGLGKILFEHFLEDEKLHVKKIAIDRPSDKFLGFLRKHYGLVHFIPQVNNFVIFEGFFDSEDSLNKPTPAYQNPNFLPNRWSSMMSVNTATDDSTLFRARGQSSQSTIACLSSSGHQSNDLWRATSYADVGRAEPVPSRSLAPQPMPIASEPARKFGHTRLW